MRTQIRRRLALVTLRKPENIRRLADYQQRKLNEEYEGSKMAVAESILHCYRHMFYPSNTPLGDSSIALAHTVIELTNASDHPGDGQRHIVRLLRDQHKLLAEGDHPNAPGFVRDQTPLKTKGSLSTLELRNEFRRAPKLSVLLGDEPLIACIREGVEQGVFIYREGSQVWGKGDPAPSIRINETAFVQTKRKLLDDCDLWCIVSLPPGVFSSAGAGVKTNLLFFTKGGPTDRVWYYDLSDIKVTKKQPLTVDRFEEFFALLPTRGDSDRSWTVTRDEIETRRFDLKAVNPNAKSTEDTRTPEELLDIIEAKGREVDAAIATLRELLKGDQA